VRGKIAWDELYDKCPHPIIVRQPAFGANSLRLV
jgi:hypothetical protein